MDDSYQLYGCIDFKTDSYAISIPVLRNPRSNYVYIPKTDQNFIIVDFYEISELGYDVQPVQSADERFVSIGQKTPVPIIQDGNVFVVDPDWQDDEIANRLPGLGNEALKAFISLRSRLAAMTMEDTYEHIETEIAHFFHDPIRSRYWISKFSALVRSSFERGQPPKKLVSMLEDARLKWLEKFASKASLKLVMSMMDVPHLKLDAKEIKRVLLLRFEGLISVKGIYLPKSELKAHEQLFPDGVIPAIRDDCSDQYEFWRRSSDISSFVSRQVYDLMRSGEYGHPKTDDPNRWTLTELDRWLLFFHVLERENSFLDEATRQFQPLFGECLALIREATQNRYELSNALFGKPLSSQLYYNLLDLFGKAASKETVIQKDWIVVLEMIVESYRKLITVSKILRPFTRNQKNEDIVLEGIDYALLGVIHEAVKTRNISVIRSILLPSQGE